MCSPSTENKQVSSSSSAVPGRLKIHRTALSSRLQQRVAATVAALTTRATMVCRNISSTGNSGGRDGNIIFLCSRTRYCRTIHHTICKPTKKSKVMCGELRDNQP